MHRKKTKIVCTISDRRCDTAFLSSLYDAGMNVARINSAHATIESATEIVENIRKVSDKIAILIDTKGPEIRLTRTSEDKAIKVCTDDRIVIKNDINGISSEKALYTNYSHFVEDVPAGAEILIDDGELSLYVVSKADGELVCRANNNGFIKGRKSINVPNVPINLPALSEKDKSFILWAIENDLDFVAHSFVRSAEDLKSIHEIIDSHKSHLKIISKIENQEGVDNIDDILENCYGIMIARGDLGVEIPAERIPIIQRLIIDKCRARKKPVIVATQMLHTMIENPRPTRAEISDVANAIFEYTDAIMLSGETASGKYPIEAVRTMRNIAIEVESQHEPEIDIAFKEVTEPVAVVLAKSIVEASCKLPIKCIVIDTFSGRTGRYISAFRPHIPVFAKCYKPHIQRELALSYGIYADFINPITSREDFIKNAIDELRQENEVYGNDLIGVLAGSFGYNAGASFIEISTASNLTEKKHLLK